MLSEVLKFPIAHYIQIVSHNSLRLSKNRLSLLRPLVFQVLSIETFPHRNSKTPNQTLVLFQVFHRNAVMFYFSINPTSQILSPSLCSQNSDIIIRKITRYFLEFHCIKLVLKLCNYSTQMTNTNLSFFTLIELNHVKLTSSPDFIWKKNHARMSNFYLLRNRFFF